MNFSLMEYIDKGGVIIYILIFLNIIGFSIMLWKLFSLTLLDKEKFIRAVIESIEFERLERDRALEVLKSELESKVKDLESGLNSVKIIATISPLFGLLGTVIGVLSSFETISKVGLGEPEVFASGISLALITTVGGLIVAIPHYIGYNYLIGLIDRLEIKLNRELLPTFLNRG